MDDLSLNIDFLINNPEVARAAAEVRREISGIDATAEKAAARVNANVNKLIDFGDSVAEVKKYQDELDKLGKGRVATSGKDEFVKSLNQDLIAGKISAIEFKAEMDRLATIKPLALSSGTAKEQIGLIERLKGKLAEVKEEADKAGNLTGVELANQKIQAYQKEINRLTNIGKQGFDDLGNRMKDALDKPIGQYNRLIYAAKLYENAAKSSANPELISKYNRKLQETQVEITRVNNVGKKGFDELGNAIKGGAGGLGKMWAGLRTVAALIPGIGLAGLLAFAIEPIMKYVSSLGLFKEKIDSVLATRKALSDVTLKGNQDAQGELTTLKLQYKAVQDVNVPLTKRKEIYAAIQKDYPAYFSNISFEQAQAGLTKNAYDQLTGSILATAKARAYADKITQNATRSLSDEDRITQLKADELKLQAQIDTRNSRALTDIRNSKREGAGITDIAAADLLQGKLNDKIKERLDLETDMRILNQQNLELEKKANAEIIKGGNLKDIPDPAKAKKISDAYINAADNLQQRVNDIEAAFARKSKSKDEEEIQAIRDKFIKIAEEVELFNSNPKNKVKVDGSSLVKTRDAAIADLQSRQQLERDKVTFDAQSQLYKAYEDYKTEYGEKEADRRYAGQIGKEKTYLTYLKSLVPNMEDTSSYANYLRDYLAKEIPKAQNEAFQEAFVNNIKNLKSVEEATKNSAALRTEIERQYNKDLETLDNNREKYTDEEFALRIQKLAENKEQQLLEVKDLAFKETAYYREAVMDVTNLSLDELKRRIREAKKELDKADLTPEKRAAANEKINTAQAGISALGFTQDQYNQDVNGSKAIAEQAKKISVYAQAVQASFHELGNAISPFNEGLGDTLSTIGDIAGVVGNAAKSAASFASGDIVGGIQGAISAIAGIFTIGAKSRESARKAQAEIAAYQDKVIKGEISYNQLLRERERTLKNISELSLKELATRQQLLDTQKSQAQQDYNRLLSIIQGSGKQITGTRTEKYGGFLGIGRKTKTVQDTAGLAGSSFAQLEELYTKGALTDATKVWFEELQKIKAEMDSIGGSTDDLFAQINQVATATTASSIADAIIQGFKDGKRTIQDFADDFKGLMQEAALSVFKSNFLNARINEFYNEFAKASAGGLTADKIEQLRASYAKIIGDSANELNDLQKVIGIDLSNNKPTATGNSLSGAIKGISADQADLLAGQVGGLRIAQSEGNQIARTNTNTMSEQLLTMKSQLLIQIKIEANTKVTADTIQSVDKSLQSIDKKMNTGSILAANGKP